MSVVSILGRGRASSAGLTPARAAREERIVSWLRLITGVLVVAALPWMPTPLPDGGTVAGQALALLAAVQGLVGLRLLGPETSATVLVRVRMASLVSDVVLALAFAILYAPVVPVTLIVLALPIQGAMKFGAPGALTVGAVAAGSGAIGQAVRAATGAGAFDVELALLPVMPGVVIGLMMAFVASTRALETAEELRRALDAERQRSNAAIIAELADDRGAVSEATRALLVALSHRTRLPLVVLIDLQADEPTELDHVVHGGYVRNRSVAIERGGPCDQASRTGLPAYSAPGEPITARGLVDGCAILAVPVHLNGRVAGLVVAETDDPDGIGPADGAAVEQTARQLELLLGLEEVDRERERLQSEIAALQNARDQVLAIGSHELRTPLTTLVGFSELFSTNGAAIAPHDVVRFGRAMHGAASRLMRTLTDVQMADNLRRRTLLVDAQPIDPQPVVSRVANLWPGTVIRTGGGGHVVADADLLATVLERLLDNAWEHGGGIDVEVGWTRVGDEVVMWVSDGGPGVPDEVRDAVTGAFVQAGDVLAHQRGTGLGLHIADGLATAMGGALVLAATGPDGTRWEVWLPTVAPDHGLDPAVEHTVTPVPSAAGDRRRSAPSGTPTV